MPSAQGRLVRRATLYIHNMIIPDLVVQRSWCSNGGNHSKMIRVVREEKRGGMQIEGE